MEEDLTLFGKERTDILEQWNALIGDKGVELIKRPVDIRNTDAGLARAYFCAWVGPSLSVVRDVLI